MKVSLSRKIHIMAFPHGTLKAARSEAQSVAMLRQPSASCAITPSCGSGSWGDMAAMASPESAQGGKCVQGLARTGHKRKHGQPHDEQEMPVHRAQGQAAAQLRD